MQQGPSPGPAIGREKENQVMAAEQEDRAD
jgi:hypothetical protein